jgi:hypothetical protein
MKLKVVRDTLLPTVTLGKLYIDGVFECHTLEDCDRKLEGSGVKIPKETAIPRGLYPVIIDYSVRFQKQMMHVLNVPQFEGVRIHAGNSEKDTEGCILLGIGRSGNTLLNSRQAVESVLVKLILADSNNSLEVI